LFNGRLHSSGSKERQWDSPHNSARLAKKEFLRRPPELRDWQVSVPALFCKNKLLQNTGSNEASNDNNRTELDDAKNGDIYCVD
jgi:hypothetical protein